MVKLDSKIIASIPKIEICKTHRSMSKKKLIRIVYNRGLRLELIRGPHTKEKMLRRPQFIGEKAYEGRKLLEKLWK